ncbi:MAG: hypothetical protein ACODAD_05780, partial [Planctomycetota bacterium]
MYECYRATGLLSTEAVSWDRKAGKQTASNEKKCNGVQRCVARFRCWNRPGGQAFDRNHGERNHEY